MIRLLLLLLLLLPVTTLAKDASDYARILEQSDRARWHEAVEGSFAKQGRLSWKSLALILPRVEQMETKTRRLVAEGLKYRSLDPRATAALARLARDKDHQVRRAAIKSLLTGQTEEVALVLEGLLNQHQEHPQRLKKKIQSIRRDLAEIKEISPPKAGPKPSAWRFVGPLLGTLSCSLLGFMLFVWGIRLLNLRRTLTAAPDAKTRSVAMGLNRLRGEVQSCDNQLLVHPLSGEPCVYYAGADQKFPNHRFWLLDEMGRILIEPAGAMILSEDGVLIPGEEVQLIGDVRHLGRRNNQLVVAKQREQRHHLESLLHFLINRLLGALFRDSTSRALFSDPSRLFWIWDDLGSAPLTSKRQSLFLFATVVAGGGWLVLLAIACIYLLW